MAGFDLGKLQVGSSWNRPSDWTQEDFVAANKAGYRYGNISGMFGGGSVSPTGPSGGFGAAIEDPRLRGKTPASTGDGKGVGMGWFKMPDVGLRTSTTPPAPPPPPKPPTTGGGGEDPGPTLDPVSVPIPPPTLPKPAMSGLAGAMSGAGFADIQRPPTDTASLGKRILPQNGMELTKRGKLWR